MPAVTTHSSQINQWLKELSDIRQENAMFKFTLSEMVDKSVMADFLARAEKMHNELIANDDSLELLIDTATHIQDRLNNGSSTMRVDYLAKKDDLQRNLTTFRARFEMLKKQFNKEMLISNAPEKFKFL